MKVEERQQMVRTPNIQKLDISTVHNQSDSLIAFAAISGQFALRDNKTGKQEVVLIVWII